MTDPLYPYDIAKLKARKTNKCCECRGTIEKGEVYHAHSGLGDGQWWNFKVCIDCDALRDEINATIRDWDEKVPFEGVGEDVFERGDDGLIRRFIEIKRKRGATIELWMIERMEAGE